MTNNCVVIYKDTDGGRLYWNKNLGWRSILKADTFKTMGGAKRSIKRYDLEERFNSVGYGFVNLICDFAASSDLTDTTKKSYWYDGIKLKNGSVAFYGDKGETIEDHISYPEKKVEQWHRTGLKSKNGFIVYQKKG